MTSYHVSISTIDAYGHKTSPVIVEWEALCFTKTHMRTIWDLLQICADGSNGSVTTALMSVDGQTVRAFRLRITGDRYSAKQYYELSTMNLRPKAYFGPEIIREGVWSEMIGYVCAVWGAWAMARAFLRLVDWMEGKHE